MYVSASGSLREGEGCIMDVECVDSADLREIRFGYRADGD